ncbi:hypothetical protein JW977_02375 [Candidatus Falkowbacteria bacterium]|nr:hypothetical protein [Candidatus Falkowbacteria bacterium]
MSNYQELKKLGLSDKEAKIYYTSLSRGPETAPNLAKLAEVVRPTTYVVIEGLIKKGLMSSTERGKKTYYVAESPEYLLSLLRIQKNDIEQKEKDLEKIIPELKTIANISGEKPNVRVFEGKEGLKAIREQLLKIKSKMIYSFAPLDKLYSLFTEAEHSEAMTKRRVGKKIKSKILYTTKKGPYLKPYDEMNLREAKYIPEKQFPFNSGIDIYDNIVSIYTFKGKIMGVIIENDDIAQTMKSIFELIWESR